MGLRRQQRGNPWRRDEPPTKSLDQESRIIAWLILQGRRKSAVWGEDLSWIMEVVRGSLLQCWGKELAALQEASSFAFLGVWLRFPPSDWPNTSGARKGAPWGRCSVLFCFVLDRLSHLGASLVLVEQPWSSSIPPLSRPFKKFLCFFFFSVNHHWALKQETKGW